MSQDGWKGVGWPVRAVVQFTTTGQDWATVERFYRDMAQGRQELSIVGLKLTNAAPHCSSACGACCQGREQPGVVTAREPEPARQSSSCDAHLIPRGVAQQPTRCSPGGAPPGRGVQPAPGPARQHAEASLLPPNMKLCGEQTSVKYGLREGGRQPVPAAGEPSAAKQQTQLRSKALREARLTFKVVLAYFGPAFMGWKWQKDVRGSVEEVLVSALAAVNRTAGERGKKVMVAAAGRTDKGVHGYGQVISFYTWDEEATPQQVLDALNAARPGELRAWHAEQVPRTFHATFQATWRHYLYLFPLTPSSSGNRALVAASSAAPGCPASGGAAAESSAADPEPEAGAVYDGEPGAGAAAAAAAGAATVWDTAAGWAEALTRQQQEQLAAAVVRPSRVHRLLQPLVGRDLNYTAFARDTPQGKDCVCRLLRARAWRCELPGAGSEPASPALAVELVGTRFLRRMVRVLVATAVREAVPAAAWFPPPPASAGAAVLTGRGAAAIAAVLPPGAPVPQPDPAGADAALPQQPTSTPNRCACSGLEQQKEHQPLNVGALLEVLATQDRLRSAPPAPAVGLCFVEAGYSEYQAGS